MTRKTVLVTNATAFAGPGAVGALLKTGCRVLAHDPNFSDTEARTRFIENASGAELIFADSPEALIEHAFGEFGRVDAIVSNDVHPARQAPSTQIQPQEVTTALDALVVAPFRLVRAAIPHFKAQGGASVVMITSCRMSLPISGGAVPDAARAATNALMKSLSVELAPDRIAVNAVAPNYLYSETYYPRAVYIDSPEGRDYIANQVPVGRLGTPEEIGELIAFLALMESRFLTGAVIDFSGGWPAAPQRLT